jgi:hypothetical protein
VTRLLVTGSRDWKDVGVLTHWLDDAWHYLTDFVGGEVTLVHGDAHGADRMAQGVWLNWGLPVEPHPADWRLGRRAGYIRNAEMVSLGADLCVAFIYHRSKGATMCAGLAEKAGIAVRRYAINY